VQGLSLETDCVFKLREKVSKLAKEVMELASLVPPPWAAPGKQNLQERMKAAMKLADIVAALELEPVAGIGLDKKVTGAYCSDLLSDVMAGAEAGSILITILTHENVVAVAALLDLAAVLFTAGKKPGMETVRLAEENGCLCSSPA